VKIRKLKAEAVSRKGFLADLIRCTKKLEAMLRTLTPVVAAVAAVVDSQSSRDGQ
jgi:hypothetical protein